MLRLMWLAIVGHLAAVPSAAQQAGDVRLRVAHSLKGHDAAIRALAFAPDGETLASAGHDRTIRLWDVGTGESKAGASRRLS